MSEDTGRSPRAKELYTLKLVLMPNNTSGRESNQFSRISRRFSNVCGVDPVLHYFAGGKQWFESAPHLKTLKEKKKITLKISATIRNNFFRHTESRNPFQQQCKSDSVRGLIRNRKSIRPSCESVNTS
ncbi:hypothetical protein AVEN_131153-1 [Araneus ventricosus]|uniref:Uncharacterized protein n=1 Tax=Araneus ventricosus TaxID=182803 RepID=A0A4Y2RXP8_ARAVE|nr:hypothetical protein AVEN_131153-1 [Araneus ventricosus]